MASINWVILDPNTLLPVPLPREKVLLTLTSVSLHLFPSSRSTTPTTGSKPNDIYKIDRGTLYLSNQRVVYVSPPKLQTGDASTSAATLNSSLETFSVPYSHFQDGRLNQPFFGANYFEATCLPAPEGGLEGTHTIRLYFKEGGGFDFYSTVLEMKERLASLPRSQRQGRSSSSNAVGEDLPLYTATPATPAPNSSSTASSTVRSMPSNSDLQAADIARQAETEEDLSRTRPSAADHPPPPATTSNTASSNPPPIGDDAPPSYTA
ncbi:hypothetical protein JCM3765_002554 [Sporobolomyces pararoseus]